MENKRPRTEVGAHLCTRTSVRGEDPDLPRQDRPGNQAGKRDRTAHLNNAVEVLHIAIVLF